MHAPLYRQCIMTQVNIEYCVPCGLLDHALDVERSLLEGFGEDLASVQLQPGHGGVFKIHVGNTLLYDKNADGPELDLEAVTETIRETTAQTQE